MDDKELVKAVKRANYHIAQLEKRGLVSISNAYTSISVKHEYYGDTTLTRTLDDEHLKFRTDIKSLTPEERKKLEYNVNAFLQAKTSTVSGILGEHRTKYNQKTHRLETAGRVGGKYSGLLNIKDFDTVDDFIKAVEKLDRLFMNRSESAKHKLYSSDYGILLRELDAVSYEMSGESILDALGIYPEGDKKKVTIDYDSAYSMAMNYIEENELDATDEDDEDIEDIDAIEWGDDDE